MDSKHDAAVARGEHATDERTDPTQYWEELYGEAGHKWSGRPNHTLVDLVSDLPAGRALDLGCGEGGDAIWLAKHGWQVTGLDISATAIERARAAAADAEVAEDRIRLVATDLSTWTADGESFDLVTACFFHSPVELDRAGVLRRAAGAVAPGGRLVIVSHGGPPPWGNHDHLDFHFPTPQDEIDALGHEVDGWEVSVAEVRSRPATGPDGEQAVLDDTVVVLRRNR